MCQECVTDGRMTQAELDRRIAAGDRSVIPIDELTLPEFVDYAAEAAATAILNGMPRDEAHARLSDEMESYLAWREGDDRPVTEDELRTVADSITEGRKAVASPWN
jgi:hypothetical protein